MGMGMESRSGLYWLVALCVLGFGVFSVNSQLHLPEAVGFLSSAAHWNSHVSKAHIVFYSCWGSWLLLLLQNVQLCQLRLHSGPLELPHRLSSVCIIYLVQGSPQDHWPDNSGCTGGTRSQLHPTILSLSHLCLRVSLSLGLCTCKEPQVISQVQLWKPMVGWWWWPSLPRETFISLSFFSPLWGLFKISSWIRYSRTWFPIRLFVNSTFGAHFGVGYWAGRVLLNILLYWNFLGFLFICQVSLVWNRKCWAPPTGWWWNTVLFSK